MSYIVKIILFKMQVHKDGNFFKILFLSLIAFVLMGESWYPMTNQMKTTCGLDTISKTRVVYI